MDWLIRFDIWLMVVGVVFVIRQLFVVFSAEKGRKADLVKKLYRARNDFNISVLVPYLESQYLSQLLELVKALDEQDYPQSRVSIHIATTQETSDDIDPNRLGNHIKLWTYPEAQASYGEATSWLIERCLAAGDAGLVVFLKPTDMVKPDFFQNVVSSGFEHSVMQGYVATKNRPESPLDHVVALSLRLINRIGNAGRYHLGLSCRLQDSGWAIKQEVLEMIPFRRGLDLDNLEYSLRLSLSNFRVAWAPNIVVYRDEPLRFLPYVTCCVGAFFNRFQIITRYSIPLLFRSIVRLDFTFFEEFLTVLKPPHFINGLLLFTAALLTSAKTGNIPGTPVIWFALATSVVVLHMLSLVVARAKGSDFLNSLLYTPLVYGVGLLLAPVAMANYVVSLALGTGGAHNPRSYKSQYRTRFNETIDPEPSLFETAHHQEAVIRDMLVENAPDEEELLAYQRQRKVARAMQALALEDGGVTEPVSPPSGYGPQREDRVVEKSVPISNGQKQVDCTLRMKTSYDTNGHERYSLTMLYKGVSFSTQAYRIMDQAFYELETKLIKRGITLITCGSCGYYYNPTADVPGAVKGNVKNAGVCLFGKKGRDVNLNTDAVTVVSQACPYHCPLEARETIVQEWRESLSSGSSLQF